MASSELEPPKMVIYDFDQTIAEHHVFYALERQCAHGDQEEVILEGFRWGTFEGLAMHHARLNVHIVGL
jgi:hypothetical protein